MLKVLQTETKTRISWWISLHETATMSASGHQKSQSTKVDILLGVGWQYALCRQVIFLSNAILVGCGMALIAAGFEQQSDIIIEWLGGTWAAVISGFGLSCLVTTLMGCFGACYEKRLLLMGYVAILVLLVIIEIIIVIFLFVQDLETLLDDRWENDLSESVKDDIREQLDCEELEDCLDNALSDAESQLDLIIGIGCGVIVYQLLMICFSIQYLRGLKRKLDKKYILKHGGEITGLSPHQLEKQKKAYKQDHKHQKHKHDHDHKHKKHHEHHSTAVEAMGSQEMKNVKWG